MDAKTFDKGTRLSRHVTEGPQRTLPVTDPPINGDVRAVCYAKS